MSVSMKLEGLGDVYQVFQDLADEIGDKKAKSKILVPAVREAMKPVLSTAQSLAPVDTGGLRLSLLIEARRPTKKDMRSKYVNQTDTVIALVTTASGKKLHAMSEGKGLLRARKQLQKMGLNAEKFKGITSDPRAIAQEFGSAANPSHPYLRPALESQSQGVVAKLSTILANRIEKFKRKMT